VRAIQTNGELEGDGVDDYDRDETEDREDVVVTKVTRTRRRGED
jgi:hypothetical protein